MTPADNAGQTGADDGLRDIDRSSDEWRSSGFSRSRDEDQQFGEDIDDLRPSDRGRSRRRATDPDVVTVGDVPQRSRRNVLALTAVIATLVVLGIVAALAFGPGSPLTQQPQPNEPTPSASPAATPTLQMLPDKFGSWTRKPDSATRGPTDSPDDLSVSSATYTSNGQDSIVLIVAGPVRDMRSYLLSIGASQIRDVDQGTCATIDETTLCGVVSGATSFAVAPLADQTEPELIDIAQQAADA